MKKVSAKQGIAHEVGELLWVFLLLAPFFVSFAMYRMYLLADSGHVHFVYGAALLSAFVMSKIVLLGEFARVGTRYENKALILSTTYKAALFTFLYLAFHVLEGAVRGLLRGQTFAGALSDVISTEKRNFLSLALLVFFAFIPFFALREIRRVVGPKKFGDLFLGAGRRPPSDVSAERTAKDASAALLP